jgi:hypothetical protein
MRTALTAAALAALALCSARPALADPNDYVASPIVEEGERELELKLGTAKLRDGSRIGKTSLAVGYGINSWWAMEVYASWHKEADAGSSFDAWEWENRFQLTETGKYPVDLGLIVEIERPKDRAEGYEMRWGPLLQAELGSQWLGSLNLLLGKHYRAAESAPAELGYQWQLKYRWKPELEFGVQGFGELGEWTHWAPSQQQVHQAGPAVFGKLHVGTHQAIKYDVGLLAGLNHESPRRTLRAKLELEF